MTGATATALRLLSAEPAASAGDRLDPRVAGRRARPDARRAGRGPVRDLHRAVQRQGGRAGLPLQVHLPGLRHFRSEPSYLPELKSYLQQLLADREQVQAATDLQDWAKAQLSPREEEITQLRDLIRRIEADVENLTDQDQALIAEAVTVIRKTRQLVNLGMPAVRAAARTG